jgi:hypothetical protein
MSTECHEKNPEILKNTLHSNQLEKYWIFGDFPKISGFTDFTRKIPDLRDENSLKLHNPSNFEKFPYDSQILRFFSHNNKDLNFSTMKIIQNFNRRFHYVLGLEPL